MSFEDFFYNQTDIIRIICIELDDKSFRSFMTSCKFLYNNYRNIRYLLNIYNPIALLTSWTIINMVYPSKCEMEFITKYNNNNWNNIEILYLDVKTISHLNIKKIPSNLKKFVYNFNDNMFENMQLQLLSKLFGLKYYLVINYKNNISKQYNLMDKNIDSKIQNDNFILFMRSFGIVDHTGMIGSTGFY